MTKQGRVLHRVSRLYHPTRVIPIGPEVKQNDILSKSCRLMVDEGVIASAQNGFFYLLPLAMRALDKLTKLVDQSMAGIGAQKILCPTLTNSSVWEKTGRLSLTGPELFQMKDRHGKSFILSPTHEESITQLLATLAPLSYKQLPLLLYQVTPKFRDEARPRFGLIRSREFLMKDLYSFDTSAKAAQATYQVVSQAYHQVFDSLGVDFLKVKGVSGVMGGEVSHEFHFPADIGDDTLRLCQSCGHGWNKEANDEGNCEQCGGNNISETKGIEVGHLFQLDTRYSSPLQAQYINAEGQKESLVMGSYGVGLTRILAAAVEVMSSSEQLKWPLLLAPYTLLIITPKEGSKESKTVGNLPEELYWKLQEVQEMAGDVLIDDRSQLTIGKRLQDARRRGFPYVAVVGKAAAAANPMIELHNTNTGQSSLLSQCDLITSLANSSQQQQCRFSASQ